jgi:hypothetical protein
MTQLSTQRIISTLAVVTLVALTCPGVSGAAGVNLFWDDCSTAGTTDKTFACNTNTGSAVLIGSFVAPSGVTGMTAIEATLDVWTSADSLPSWWQFGTGGCRAGRLSTSFDFASSGPYTCTDPWNGAALGGNAYAVDSLGAKHARLRLVAAVTPDLQVALNAGQEYYAFKVTITFQKTTGAGACSGCDVPISIALSSLTLCQAAGAGNVLLTDPASSNVATWQGGAGSFYAQQGSYFGQIRSILR